MDIHRCRFVPYQPQAINALAFSHTSHSKQATPTDLRLALGRENGDLEIWNPSRGSWTQEKVFRGGVGRTIEQVQWTQDFILPDEDEEQQKPEHGRLRLFSSGGSRSITEWDIEKGVPRRHAEGNSGDIWCFAPQPQWTTAQARNSPTEVQAAPSQFIAAGCADGSIVLFSTADDDFRFDRVLTQRMKKNSRCISLTWRDRNTVVAGFEESTIRVFDIRNKSVIRQMTLGKSRDGAQVLVWAVKCLPNGTILSGDSSGELKVWDSENFSLVQRLKTHAADVLDITTNQAGTMILTCGVDRRTVAYVPIANQPSQKTQRWNEIRHRRFHEHDVKCITSFESKSLSIGVSGGMDTVPIVVPLKNWNEEYHRALPYLPQKPQLSVSTTARLMLTWWARDLLIWLLPQRYRESTDADSANEEQTNHQLLAQIQLKDEEHITSAQISSSGNMIIAATSNGVKLFQIRRSITGTGQAEVRTRPLELPKVLAGNGASTVGFSPDNKWLYAVRLNNVITLAKITATPSSKERPTIYDRIIKLDRKRRVSLLSQTATLGDYSRHITTVAFSSDSRILAAGDLSGAVDTWTLEGHEAAGPVKSHETFQNGGNVSDNETSESGSEASDSDSEDETDSRVLQGQRWIRTPSGSQLPNLENAILALSFKPSTAVATGPSQINGNEGLHATRQTHHPISPEHPSAKSGFLMAVTSTHQIVEFDTMNCRLSDWSRRNPSTLLPAQFTQIKDRVMGIWFDVRPAVDVSRLWLYGANFVYMLDLSRDLKGPNELKSSSENQSSLVKVGQLGNHTLQVEPDHALVRNDSVVGTGNVDGDEHGAEQTSRKRKRRNDGAGDEMRPNERYNARSRVIKADEALDAGMLSPPGSVTNSEENHSDNQDEMDIDDDDNKEDVGLVIRRRNLAGTAEQTVSSDGSRTKGREQRASWCTFQYRGILGICALQHSMLAENHADDDNGRSGGKEMIERDHEGQNQEPPEVVIVERPMYDVELAPRFTNGQEW